MNIYTLLLICLLMNFGLLAQDNSRLSVLIGANQSLAIQQLLGGTANYKTFSLGIERTILLSEIGGVTLGTKLNKNDIQFSRSSIRPAEQVDHYTTVVYGLVTSYLFDSNFYGGFQFGYEFGLSEWVPKRDEPKGLEAHLIIGYDINVGEDYILSPKFEYGDRFITSGDDNYSGYDYSLLIVFSRRFW